MRNLNSGTDHSATYPAAVFATVRQSGPRPDAGTRAGAGTTTLRLAPAAPLHDATEAHALRALAADGFGEAVFAPAGGYGHPTSASLHAQGRSWRSRAVGDVLARIWRAAARAAQRTFTEWQRHERIRATYRTLRELDDRTLRDLGFHRSEIPSVAAELHGSAGLTRVHAAQARGR